MNIYPKEYLEIWSIKEELVKEKTTAQNLKTKWVNQGYTCRLKKISFGLGISYSVIGLKDKTNTKTKQQIKEELKTF